MLIRCPECQFARDVPEGKIPPNAIFATCPKCTARFRIRGDSSDTQKPDTNPPVMDEAPSATPVQNQAPSSQPATPDAPLVASQAAGLLVDQPYASDAPMSTSIGTPAVKDPLANAADIQDSTPVEGEAYPEAGPAESEATRQRPDKGAVHHDFSKSSLWDEIESMPRTWEESAEQNNLPPVPQQQGEQKSYQKVNLEDADPQYFTAPIGNQANSIEAPFLPGEGTVMWEYRGGFFKLRGFLRTFLESILRPSVFYSGISNAGSLLPAVLYGVLIFAIFCVPMLSLPVLYPGEDGVLVTTTMQEVLSLPQILLFYTFIYLLMLFFNAFLANALVNILSGGKAIFRRTFKVVAYAITPLIFACIPFEPVMLAAKVAYIVLVYLGLRHAYDLPMPKAIIGCGLHFAAIFLLGAIIGNYYGLG